MNLKTLTPGTVLVIGALSLSVGWLAGSTSTSNQKSQAEVTPRQRSNARPPRGADDVAPFTGELRRRLDTQPPRKPSTGRNPFSFGTRRAPSVSRSRVEPEAAPATAPEPVAYAPPASQFKLSGIASNQEAGAVVLTAVINDNGALVFAKTGDKLSNGGTVVSISETAVVIMDIAGVSQTIRLP